MLFSAIAMVAFAGSAFASNEVIIEKQSEIEKISQDDECFSCPMTINTVDSKGNILYSETKNYRVCTMSCDQAREQVKTFLATGKIIAPN